MEIYRSDFHHFEGPQLYRETLFDIGINDLGDPETPIEVQIVAHQEGEDFLLRGTVQTELTLPCDRCLGVAHHALNGSFEVWLLAEARPDLEVDEDDILIVPFARPKVDLSEIISRTVYLELPRKMLCHEDCRGLCPTCGTDLNQQSCECQTVTFDERWSALLDIKQHLKE